MTMSDALLQQQVKQYQRVDVPVRVSRLIGVGAEDSILDAEEPMPFEPSAA